ncbi:DNA-3-methyladenine glycosylase 2 family protein [Candidatus Heimdallarchaeota archaeon]|nr:MAG: DNA-3-methyladenine glycosylase 2 family protein [Candidatus Heimdallarchaeota archaeon]
MIDHLDEELSLRHSENYFHDLAEIIIFQQLSGKAARTIFNRFLALFPEKKPIPELLLPLDENVLSAAGVSRQKRRYLKSLAENFVDKTIQPELFNEMSDKEIIDKLTQVKGIGKWTAEIFLMFNLGQEDVFPSDDLGLRKALQQNFSLLELPSAKEAALFAEKWSPYRTIAALLLWRSLRIELPD